jgi:plastocyanin
VTRTFAVLIAALLVSASAVALAGCGGDDDEGTDTATATDTTDTTDTGDGVEAGAALTGTVGPGFDISLTTVGGESVSTLQAGSYELTIEDLSSVHNFHLTGPGVDLSTDVGEEGTQNVSLDVASGTYEFVCDPHASQMSGSFTVP